MHQPGGIVKAAGLRDGPTQGKIAIAELRCHSPHGATLRSPWGPQEEVLTRVAPLDMLNGAQSSAAAIVED